MAEAAASHGDGNNVRSFDHLSSVTTLACKMNEEKSGTTCAGGNFIYNSNGYYHSLFLVVAAVALARYSGCSSTANLDIRAHISPVHLSGVSAYSHLLCVFLSLLEN